MSLYTWLTKYSSSCYDLSTTRYSNWTSENNLTNIQYLEEYFYPVQLTINNNKIKEYISEVFDEKKDDIVNEVMEKLKEKAE